MIKFLKNLFNPRQEGGTTLASQRARIEGKIFDIREVDASDLSAYPNAFKDIYDRRFDGMVIRNVILPEEVDLLRKNLSNLPEEKKRLVPPGWVYPISFAEVHKRKNPAEAAPAYFDRAEESRQEFKSLFGFDFEARVEMVFNQLAGDRKVEIPCETQSGSSFSGLSLRILNPEKGGIHLHSGNYFQSEFPDFFTYLSKMSTTEEQLSYFVLFQLPEAGGELTLYDLEWNDAFEKETLYENNVIQKKDGTMVDVRDESQCRQMRLIPRPGDMVIFDGGQIWHRVEDILGSKDRITIGGFLTFSHDFDKIYYWA